MTVVVHRDLGKIPRGEWNVLASRAVTGTVFQTYEWHRAWIHAFGVAEGLRIVSVRDAGGLRAIAPFRLDGRRGERILRFVGDERSDYADVIYCAGHEECLTEILDALRHGPDEIDAIELNNIPAASPTVGTLERGGARGWRVFRSAAVPCPAMAIAGEEAFVRQVLQKKSLRRHARHYEKIGGLRVEHLREAAEIRGELPAFFTQHIQRWALRGPQSLFVDRENREFYLSLAAEMAASGVLIFTVVRSQGRPIAYHFGFHDGQKLLWYKPSFDIAEAAHYPGEVLLKALIEYAQGRGLAELDFTRGDEFFKSRFANRIRRNHSIMLCRTLPAATARWMKNRVGRSPMLRSAAETALALKDALRPAGLKRKPEDPEPAVRLESTHRDHYDSARVVEQYRRERGLQKPEAEILNRLRPELPGMKMLDAGVGAGRTSVYFVPLVKAYAAFDASPNMVLAARRLVGDYVDPEVFAEGDIRRMPFPDDAEFDFVLISYNTIDCVSERERQSVLSEVRRVLKPGGRFCFSSHNLESLTVRGARGIREFLKRVRRYRLLAAANENLGAARSMDQSMIRDASTDYRIPIYYIGPCAQIRQLEAAGFTDVQVFSLNSGREIDPREPDVRFADSWLYYLCRSVKG